jgi:hypothetical protein
MDPINVSLAAALGGKSVFYLFDAFRSYLISSLRVGLLQCHESGTDLAVIWGVRNVLYRIG